MKHCLLLTLLFAGLLSSAQLSRNDKQLSVKHTLPANNFNKTPQRSAKWAKPEYAGKSAAASRSQNLGFFLDYGALDDAYNENVLSGAGYFYQDGEDGSFFLINGHMPEDSVDFNKFAITWYPRIIDMENNEQWPFNEYDPNKIQMVIDTIGLTLGHLHTANRSDTVILSVWDLDDFQNVSFDTGATGTLYGRITMITDTSLLGGTGEGSTPGTFLYGTRFFVPTSPIVIPQGKQFLIQVDFYGPSEDQFMLFSSRRNDCASQCGASIPYVNASFNEDLANFNSFYLTSDGYPSTAFYVDCNENEEKDSICEEIITQNFDIYPHITAVIPQFYVDITPGATIACPNSTVSLTANGGGSNALPYTYSWEASSGALSSTEDQQVNITLDDALVSDTIIVTLTDANSVSVKDTVIIRSSGISVNISNPTKPIAIDCGNSATITTAISGNTTGRFYTWSTGEQGSNKTTITVGAAANISVTVTNNSGCSATSSVAVNYPGVNNVVNFSVPGNRYVGCPLTFRNTSTQTASPWVATFYPIPTDSLVITDGNPLMTYTYAGPGVFNVKLTMDSAGCVFSGSKAVTVIALPNGGNCGVGINDLVENNSQLQLFPNPAMNELHIVTEGFMPDYISVYDMNGRKLSEGKFTQQINIGTLSAGIYYIEVRNTETVARKRLLKM